MPPYPYFVKVYVHDGDGYRYRCTSPLKDMLDLMATGWPEKDHQYIFLGLDHMISTENLESFSSLSPTKERICP